MYWTIGKTVSCKQIRPTSVFRDVKWIFDASRGFIGLDVKYIQICDTNIYCYLNFTNQSNVVDVVDHNSETQGQVSEIVQGSKKWEKNLKALYILHKHTC